MKIKPLAKYFINQMWLFEHKKLNNSITFLISSLITTLYQVKHFNAFSSLFQFGQDDTFFLIQNIHYNFAKHTSLNIFLCLPYFYTHS